MYFLVFIICFSRRGESVVLSKMKLLLNLMMWQRLWILPSKQGHFFNVNYPPALDNSLKSYFKSLKCWNPSSSPIPYFGILYQISLTSGFLSTSGSIHFLLPFQRRFSQCLTAQCVSISVRCALLFQGDVLPWWIPNFLPDANSTPWKLFQLGPQLHPSLLVYP